MMISIDIYIYIYILMPGENRTCLPFSTLYSINSLKNFTHSKNQRKGVHRNIKDRTDGKGKNKKHNNNNNKEDHTTQHIPCLPSNTTRQSGCLCCVGVGTDVSYCVARHIQYSTTRFGGNFSTTKPCMGPAVADLLYYTILY